MTRGCPGNYRKQKQAKELKSLKSKDAGKECGQGGDDDAVEVSREGDGCEDGGKIE